MLICDHVFLRRSATTSSYSCSYWDLNLNLNELSHEGVQVKHSDGSIVVVDVGHLPTQRCAHHVYLRVRGRIHPLWLERPGYDDHGISDLHGRFVEDLRAHSVDVSHKILLGRCQPRSTLLETEPALVLRSVPSCRANDVIWNTVYTVSRHINRFYQHTVDTKC